MNTNKASNAQYKEEILVQLSSIFSEIPIPKLLEVINSTEGEHPAEFYVDKVLEMAISLEQTGVTEASPAQTNPISQTVEDISSTFEMIPNEEQVEEEEEEAENEAVPTPAPVEQPKPVITNLSDALLRIAELELEVERIQHEKKKTLQFAISQVENFKEQLVQKDKLLAEQSATIKQQSEKLDALEKQQKSVEERICDALKTTRDRIVDGGSVVADKVKTRSNSIAKNVDQKFNELEKALPSGSSMLEALKTMLKDIAEGSRKLSVAANEKFNQLKEEYEVTKVSMQSYIDELQRKLNQYEGEQKRSTEVETQVTMSNVQEEVQVSLNNNNNNEVKDTSTQVETPLTDRASQTATNQ